MDTQSMKYDLSLVKKGQLVTEVFPELLEYKEFANPEHDDLLKIAFYATDENSPFLKKDRDNYENRIKAIFDYLQIKDKKLLKDILVNDHPDYSAIVNRFFIQIDNLAYVVWSNMLFNFHMIGIALREAPNMNQLTSEMDKRAKLQAQQNTLHKELIAYEAQIFSDIPTRKIARKEIAKILTLPERFSQDKTVI